MPATTACCGGRPRALHLWLIPRLGSKPLISRHKLRKQQPSQQQDLDVGNKEIREELAALNETGLLPLGSGESLY